MKLNNLSNSPSLRAAKGNHLFRRKWIAKMRRRMLLSRMLILRLTNRTMFMIIVLRICVRMGKNRNGHLIRNLNFPCYKKLKILCLRNKILILLMRRNKLKKKVNRKS